jgi:hypothetical protein
MMCMTKQPTRTVVPSVCLQLSLQLLAGKAAPASTAGLLADTLHLLAAGLEDAPQRIRKDLSLKLLLLFSDVAALVGGSSGIVRADLGDLLVAVAVAAEGLQSTVRLLGGSSSSNSSNNSLTRMSVHDIQRAQREGASTTRLFRSLWLYTAMHKLVSPAAGVSVAAAAGGGVAAGDVQWEWQSAAGRLAAVTPLLMVGTNSYFEADMVERLKVRLETTVYLSLLVPLQTEAAVVLPLSHTLLSPGSADGGCGRSVSACVQPAKALALWRAAEKGGGRMTALLRTFPWLPI